MKEAYGPPIAFRDKTLALIFACDAIVTDYVSQGLRMTVRQLYYQLVAKNLIPNTVTSYDNVQNMVNNARLAGLIDWDAIEDRTRAFIERPHWTSGSDILHAVATQYHEDMWNDQENRVFVVVEKEALAGVLDRACREWDCPLLAARGYPSASVLREFVKERILPSTRQVVVLHLGDHDPSGIDMTRDLVDRIDLFARGQIEVNFKRIALTMDQIHEVDPPANPAKQTDARFKAYQEEFGTDESWELDALTPTYLYNLVTEHVSEYIDHVAWEQTTERIERVKAKLNRLAESFDKDNE